MSDPDLHRLAVAVEQLSGHLNTGVATLRGDINVLATREQHNSDDITELRAEVNELKGRRFPFQVTSGIMSVAAVCVAAYAAAGKG